MKRSRSKEWVSFKVAFIYAVFSALWILLSDQILFFLVKDPEMMTKIQMIKGWLFILISATIIFILLRREIKKYWQANTALQKSEEKYRFLLNSSNDAVFVHQPSPEGRLNSFMEINDVACGLYGYTREEFLSKSPIDLVVPEQQKELDGFVRELIQNKTNTFETIHRHKDGRIFPVEVSAYLFQFDDKLTVLSIVRDISERKKAEKELQDSQERFISVLNGIDAIIYVSDLETHEILFMNQYMKNEFHADLTGECCWKVFRDNVEPCLDCTNKKLLDKDGKPTGVHVWDEKNRVTGKWYINRDRAIRWTDGRYVRLQIATDITELKRMENELRHTHKMESIGTLTGGIAHEFNNILGIIIGNTELALDDIPDWNPSHANLKKIKTAGLRAKDVVRQLLSFSRKTDKEQKPIDAARVVSESIDLIRSSTPSNIEIHRNIPDSPVIIHADATQINQVMINLCTNAVHAMPDGGKLEIIMNPIQFRKPDDNTKEGVPPGNYMELIIKDTGVGIVPEDYERIFDPYFTTKEVGKGTGMGLSVVHGIVKNHEGQVSVESEPGSGSTFTIVLPMLEDQPVPVNDKKNDQHGDQGSGNILFVDDEEYLVDMAKSMLETMGYQVTTATNPEDALKIFESGKDLFDLVISDMTMPQMTGVQFTEKIRQIQPDIPIIICTGHSSLLDKETAESMGLLFTLKPLTRSDLAALIQKALGTKNDELYS